MRAPKSWFFAVTVAVIVALAPSTSFAKGFGRGGGRSGGSRGSGAASSGGFGRRGTSAPVISPNGRRTYYFQGNGGAPAQRGYGEGYGRGYGYGEGYSRGYRYGRSYGYASPYYDGYYSGWGVYPWGYYSYGYYPVWGAPPVTDAPDVVQGPRTRAFSLFLGGAFQSQGFAPTGSLTYEGERWGFNLGGIGVVSPPVASHLTFSVVSNPHMRVRLELGGSAVGAPSQSYFGADFGASAQVALMGPLGIQGALHYTPYPAKVLDAEAGVGLSFGGLGLRAGWRYLRLDDSSFGGGVDSFSGPAVSIGAVY
jgi:hypothetical protein